MSRLKYKKVTKMCEILSELREKYPDNESVHEDYVTILRILSCDSPKWEYFISEDEARVLELSKELCAIRDKLEDPKINYGLVDPKESKLDKVLNIISWFLIAVVFTYACMSFLIF